MSDSWGCEIVAISPDWITEDKVREHGFRPIAILLYSDGSRRFAHVCQRSAGRGTIACAPLLHKDHNIVSEEPLTIEPSIMCSDCGTHGFVRNGVWMDA